MSSSKPVIQRYPSLINSPIVSQVLAVIFRSQFFHRNPPLPPQQKEVFQWKEDTVSLVLTTIPRLLFRPPSSIGAQKTSSLRRQKPNNNNNKINNRTRNSSSSSHHRHEIIGLHGAIRFYNWLESHAHFSHTELTCRHMARLLGMVCGPKTLWLFLKSVADRRNKLITTPTITCLIKVLGEGGLVNTAFSIFSKMKRLHCTPDVISHNAIIQALCGSGRMWRARLVLGKMELPWSNCQPDAYTYTIFITHYCRRGVMERSRNGREESRRCMQEANRMFREMVSRKGLVLDAVGFNCLINGCCRSGRLGRALEVFGEMRRLGCEPNRVTFDSFIRYYSRVNQVDEALAVLRRMEGCGLSPGCSSYTPVIHGLCEAGRVREACSLMEELVRKGYVPREYTFWLVSGFVKGGSGGGFECEMGSGEMWRDVERRIEERRKSLSRLKPCIRWKYKMGKPSVCG